MPRRTQTYRYIIRDSIIGLGPDEYALTERECYRIYSFFVTYSMCEIQSAKKRSFTDYGWNDNTLRDTELKRALMQLLTLPRNPRFIFTEADDLRVQFTGFGLGDGPLANLLSERAVVGVTPGDNQYLKLFYRIRDGFAHGKYRLCATNNHEKMVVIQDDNRSNVTSRVVLKLSTILVFVDSVDINGLI